MSVKITLVLGASLKESRYSNLVIHKLINKGHEVFAFGMATGIINKVEVDTELKPYQNIDTVTLYLNPKHQPDYYDYVVGLNPKRVIFNPGTENPEFYILLDQHQINYEIACSLVLLSTNQY